MSSKATSLPPSLAELRELSQQLRVDSIRASDVKKSGHPTSSMSAADLMAVLFAKYLRYDFDQPENRLNDHLIFSKGHASPLLYSLYLAAGAISEKELLSFRTFGSRLQGHPTPLLRWVDVATGSLGFGLPVGVGIALSGKRLEEAPYRVWVLCGDSEMAEGSIWEALEHAAHYELDNLVVIVDVNRLGQRGETMNGWQIDRYLERARAFGCRAIATDGHDLAAIDRAFAEAIEGDRRPTVIVAKTIKGKGVAALENQETWHGKALADPEAAIAELGGIRRLRVQVAKPHAQLLRRPGPAPTPAQLPRYELAAEVATRRAYGEALAALGSQRPEIVGLDGEVSNSTYADLFSHAHPERYFEMFIAEQQLVAAAVGLQVRGWKPFASTFAAFFTRAYDFIRMAAISGASIKLCGSHAGVSIGEDGPSQMGLEDIAMLRAVHGSSVLYPCDANQTATLVARMADRDGIVYLRTTRAALPVLYGADDEFEIGGSRVIRSSERDQVAIVAAGITVHEALKAASRLEADGIRARVIDLYSVKPIDTVTLREAALVTGGRLLTVEDHWPEGGVGEAVQSVFAEAGRPLRVVRLAVRGMPGSGTPAELLAAAGIDATAIAKAARRLALETPGREARHAA
jgi:transketolase